MSGRRTAGCGLRIADFRPRARRALSSNPQSAVRSPQSRGFTLLELMIVISILVILALIAMAQYNKTVLAAREATLREDLFTMRRMIDQYAADKGKLPQSLDDLKSAGYIHEIPIDPMTDAADWQIGCGEAPAPGGGERGVPNAPPAPGKIPPDGWSRYN